MSVLNQQHHNFIEKKNKTETTLSQVGWSKIKLLFLDDFNRNNKLVQAWSRRLEIW